MGASLSQSIPCLRCLLIILTTCTLVSMVIMTRMLPKKERRKPVQLKYPDDVNARHGYPAYNSSPDHAILPTVTSLRSDTFNRSWCQGMILRGLDYVIVYNAVPKSGSRTISSLARRLFSQHRDRRGKSLFIPYDLYRDEPKLKRFFSRHKSGPVIMRGHSHFTQMSGKQYVYINIIRDPVQRYISHLYYSWYGDSNNMAKKNGLKKRNIDECVLSDRCRPKGYLPFFCGFHPNCSDSTNRWSLEQAVSNLDKFLVVGLTEEMDDTIKVLEKLLPDLFKGMYNAYKRSERRMKKSYSTVAKDLPNNETMVTLRGSLSQTYELYDMVKMRFHHLKKCLGIV